MTQTKNISKALLIFAALAVVMILARIFNLGNRMGELREWIQSLGSMGPLVYLGIYIMAVLLAVPGTLISIMAGVLFGSYYGVILASIGSTVGASLAFLISRHFAREAIAEKFSGKNKFRYLDHLTREHGAILVALTRLVPLFPFNLLNYGFGLTQVSFWTYVFWSWLCMLPWTIVYVVGTDSIIWAFTQRRVPALLIIILAVTLFTIAVLARLAKKQISLKGYSEKNE